ncbi:MAG: hypothetical protein BM556_15625 [Bacteriovorax sp. MedPE-SWde]|nr:MAG: hypothetical protein BM556_15625 [Bacteriovorax sp. MedPE-SWde]
MFRVGTNYQSMVAQRRLGDVSKHQSEERTKLSSGSRITEAAFDPAGLAIATGMKARSVSNMQAQRNVNDGISLLQVAEGTLSVMHGIASRLRELAMQAANDTVGAPERAVANKEFQQLTREVKRLTASTKYNGNHIINGKGSTYELQIGIHNDPQANRLKYDLQKVLASNNNFGLDSQNILSKDSARGSFAKIDSMINEVSSSRAKLGGAMNRMQSATQNLQIGRENLEASKSKITDADVAMKTTNIAKDEIVKSATLSLLAQANSRPALASKLIDA